MDTRYNVCFFLFIIKFTKKKKFCEYFFFVNFKFEAICLLHCSMHSEEQWFAAFVVAVDLLALKTGDKY